MNRSLSIFALFIFALSFEAAKLNTLGSTVITGTLTVTNAAAITGTNGESITINGDTRTWTNSVHSAATQILVSTNNSTAGARLVMNLAVYPVTGLQLGGNGSTVIVLRTAPDGPLVWTLSTNNWASLTFATNTVGSATVVRLPLSIESASTQTNIASLLMEALNSSANTNKLDAAKISGLPPGGAPAEIAGWVQLSSGAATVINTNVATNSLVFLTRLSNDGTVAAVNEDYVHRTNGASFSILSSTNSDTNVVAWKLLTLASVTNMPVPNVPSLYFSPFAYYRLDEAGTGTLHDEVATNDLTTISGTPAYAAGQITNAVSADNWSAGITNSAFEFSGGDWCIRFWIYRTAAAVDGIMKRRSSGPSAGWQIANDNFGSVWNITLDFWDTSSSDEVRLAPLSTSAWHEIVAYGKNGVEFGMKADNGTWVKTSDANALKTTSAPFYLNNITSGTQYIDELAIWKGYIPTDAELTTDWNSGAGKTYPLGP